MAEVEKLSAATATAAATAADIPVTSGGASNDSAVGGSAELGTSPTQERSSNSHPHDSEYDTASDLEGGEDYDDDDDDDLGDEDGDSITDDDDDDEDDDDDDDDHGQGVSPEKSAEAEAQKKVDEDRSNPQYIPKRGTFYEHDDRTAEVVGDGVIAIGEAGESQEGGVNGAKSPQTPMISYAAKSMKKWQPASGVERWSHDRFDASEQAPKSRSELVSAYGYDIRTEDAPPRARRRRRYGRGPSKYSRNWEDENAYLKASNKERKPPRASDFPALSERGSRARKSHGTAEEKENRVDRRQGGGGDKLNTPSHRAPHSDDNRKDRNDGKMGKGKGYGKQNAAVGRQAAMEFKQKQKNGQQQSGHPNNNMQNTRVVVQMDGPINRAQNSHNSINNDQSKTMGKGQSYQKHVQPQSHHQQQQQQNDEFSNSSNKMLDHPYQQQQPQQQIQSTQQQNMLLRQPLPPSVKTLPSTNLSQRLQQVQNRNDPSHVGSVQMHSLASQNQLIGQQPQQQPNPGMMMSPPPPQQQQQQQQPNQQLPQEQRGPKRYSSLRRSQHEAQHIAEQHQLQQLHLQQQQQQPLSLQDQHLLQTNLMQIYHQDNLQAQMQALQVTPGPAQGPKQPAYNTVPQTAQPQPQSYGAGTGATGAPTAYYVAAPDAYAATAVANAQVAQAPQYAQPPPPNYLPQPQTATSAAALAYANTPPPPQQAVAGAPPAAYGPPPAAPPAAPATSAPQTGGPNANPNFSNYQNYNTVGGTTYFVPPAQTTTRPVVLPQRRPTNAIPILPPSEKNKQRASEPKDEPKNSGASPSSAPIGSSDNIDHIIDNMFVQRPAFQHPQATAAGQPRKSTSPPSATDSSLTNSSDLNTSSTQAATQADDSAVGAANNSTAVEKVNNSGVDGGAPIESNNSNSVVPSKE